MNELIFCTGNNEKFLNASYVGKKHGVTILQEKLEIDEIQSEDAELILMDKLQKAYALMQKPVVVSDDSWEIPALNGFPGPYMKSINHWLAPEDYLRLTFPLEDRSIYLIQRLGYTDGTTTKTFAARVAGTISKEIKGDFGGANHKLVCLEGDDGKTIAEIYDAGLNHSARGAAAIWDEFLDWFTEHNITRR